ncbi:hypothetical protein PR048_023912 [Dryococelus australis]|uniref:Uncharacterized protein n=1 Tax=Dryococelus australis TaxID=614101 RepID=A0ABQ9GVD6_9NEOP|nr:hypothetical protein PR048_023912 [Dryococelus australis]
MCWVWPFLGLHRSYVISERKLDLEHQEIPCVCNCPSMENNPVVVVPGDFADLPWHSQLVRHRSGVRQALGSNPRVAVLKVKAAISSTFSVIQEMHLQVQTMTTFCTGHSGDGHGPDHPLAVVDGQHLPTTREGNTGALKTATHGAGHNRPNLKAVGADATASGATGSTVPVTVNTRGGVLRAIISHPETGTILSHIHTGRRSAGDARDHAPTLDNLHFVYAKFLECLHIVQRSPGVQTLLRRDLQDLALGLDFMSLNIVGRVGCRICTNSSKDYLLSPRACKRLTRYEKQVETTCAKLKESKAVFMWLTDLTFPSSSLIVQKGPVHVRVKA